MKHFYHTLGLLTLLIIILSSCSKEKGCTDPNAINYRATAQVSGNCNYSTVTFYAEGETWEGIKILSVEIEVQNQVIGEISTFNQPFPTNCHEIGTVQYTFNSSVEQTWFARYTLANGGMVTHQQQMKPSSSEACIKINVTP